MRNPLDRLRSRTAPRVVKPDAPTNPVHVDDAGGLFAAAYGSNPVPERLRSGTTFRFYADEDADRAAGGELTAAQREGVRIMAELAQPPAAPEGR